MGDSEAAIMLNHGRARQQARGGTATKRQNQWPRSSVGYIKTQSRTKGTIASSVMCGCGSR
jgi:hypothetical protein